MHGEPLLLWMLILPLAGSAVAMFMPVHARNAVAWLGASAAIFHTMNHATFKASPFKATGVATGVVAFVAIAALTLLGALGLLRMPTFYERVHAPTLGTTLGTFLILAASMLLFSVLASRPVLHEIAIAVFVTVTTPVTYMLLLRAAVRRQCSGDGS